jgi:hypothetical protein
LSLTDAATTEMASSTAARDAETRSYKIPPLARKRLGEALDRLIALAEATNKADEAKKWKDEKARLPAEPAAPKPATERK